MEGDSNMALTKKALKAMGLTDEQVDSIVEMHAETVDGLKSQIADAKADREQLADLQKQLEAAQAELETAKKDSYKEKYESEKKAFQEYKDAQTAKEAKAAREQAARAYYQSKGITGKALEIAMRGSGAEVDALELGENGKVTSYKALDDLIAGDFSGLVGKTTVEGAPTPTPPETGNGSKPHGTGRAARIAASYHEDLYGTEKE